MNRKNRRGTLEFGMSFLDIICCGFGAILLLLLIIKIVEPQRLAEMSRNLEAQVIEREMAVLDANRELRDLNIRIQDIQLAIDARRQAIAKIRTSLNDELALLDLYQKQMQDIDGRIMDLRLAREALVQEINRLITESRQYEQHLVTGIPADSEFIIFIIDTSGSMFNHSWNMVQDQIQTILNIYPKVRGIQVLNDMGEYMFENYRGRWIPDTPNRRKAIRAYLKNWNAFSNSSPVEGIQRAIRDFRDPEKNISIYVFGDEFTGRSIERVIETISLINRPNASGTGKIRIHAVGFPVQYGWQNRVHVTGVRFATLMRELTHKNDGTFVGLAKFY